MSAFSYVFGLLMRALHTTEMLISGAFPRASRRFRASPLSQAALGSLAGHPGVPSSSLCRWDPDPLGAEHPAVPRDPFAPCKRPEAQTPHIPAGTRYRGSQLDASCVSSAETFFPVSFTPKSPSPSSPPPRPGVANRESPLSGRRNPCRPGDPRGSPPGTPLPRCPGEGRGVSAARLGQGRAERSPAAVPGPGAEGSGGGGGGFPRGGSPM